MGCEEENRDRPAPVITTATGRCLGDDSSMLSFVLCAAGRSILPVRSPLYQHGFRECFAPALAGRGGQSRPRVSRLRSGAASPEPGRRTLVLPGAGQAGRRADVRSAQLQGGLERQGGLAAQQSDGLLCLRRRQGSGSTIPTERIKDNCLRFKVKEPAGSYYLARLEPYGLAELESLKRRLAGNPSVEIAPIGKTVEGRDWRSSASATRMPPAACSCGPARIRGRRGATGSSRASIERLLRDDSDATAVSGQILRLHHAPGQQGRRRPRADAVQRARGRPEPALGPAGRSRDLSRELRLESWLEVEGRRRTGPAPSDRPAQ